MLSVLQLPFGQASFSSLNSAAEFPPLADADDLVLWNFPGDQFVEDRTNAYWVDADFV
ncbi:hypothetical protein D3C76_1553790 [compost metagenome]